MSTCQLELHPAQGACAQPTVGPGSLAVAYHLPLGRAASGNRRDAAIATGRDILSRAMVLARAGAADVLTPVLVGSMKSSLEQALNYVAIKT